MRKFQERNSISRLVVFSVFIILLVSVFLGEALPRFFGIGINSFRVAGGILIFLMALSMLHAKTSAAIHTKEDAEESVIKNSIAIVPSTMPLLAGPGASSTIILYAHMGNGVQHHLIVGLEILFDLYSYQPGFAEKMHLDRRFRMKIG